LGVAPSSEGNARRVFLPGSSGASATLSQPRLHPRSHWRSCARAREYLFFSLPPRACVHMRVRRVRSVFAQRACSPPWYSVETFTGRPLCRACSEGAYRIVAKRGAPRCAPRSSRNPTTRMAYADKDIPGKSTRLRRGIAPIPAAAETRAETSPLRACAWRRKSRRTWSGFGETRGVDEDSGRPVIIVIANVGIMFGHVLSVNGRRHYRDSALGDETINHNQTCKQIRSNPIAGEYGRGRNVTMSCVLQVARVASAYQRSDSIKRPHYYPPSL